MKQFFRAIADNDALLFHSLLGYDASLAGSRNEQGVSAVLYALYYRRPALADKLIEAGAPLDIFEAAALGNMERLRQIVRSDPGAVNSFSPDGFQPLGLAAFFGRTDAALYLLRKGADPNSPSRNTQKVTPLHCAASSNSIQIAFDLIRRGANVNARQLGGYTPLHDAVRNGSSAMVRLLIRSGANCLSMTDMGETPKSIRDRSNVSQVDDLLRACAG
jgi:ankyrin repeat protein